jgi:hypothetical protein
MKVKIGYGVPDGEEVYLPVHQTFIDASTGAGKTVLLKSLAVRVANENPEYRILLIDSKDERDFEDFHRDIPLCFLETTEPLVLRDLMSAILTADMMYYFDSIIEQATFDTLGELYKSLDGKIKAADKGELKIHGKELGKLRVIWYALRKLTTLLNRPDISPDLQLSEGINVMNLSMPKFKEVNYKTAFQQLMVRSTILHLGEFRKVLFFIDEAHKWFPQKWSSVVKQPASELVAEGRGGERWIFIADQASSKVDKEPLKPCHNWIIGMQKQPHEVEDAMEMLSDLDMEVPIKARDVKNLRTGFFWVVTDDYVRQVYAQPWWLPDEVAARVAKGELRSDADEITRYEKQAGTGRELAMAPAESQGHLLASAKVLTEEEDWSDVVCRVEEVEARLRV